MKATNAGLLLLALMVPATATEVTPVQKVIQLMNGMLDKGKAEKHDEQVQFAAYKQFCDDTSVEKTRSIVEAKECIEGLAADIEKYTATAAKLTKEIAVHDEDVAVWKGDVKAATKVRKMEKSDYDQTHKDYSESVDALERAIDVLKKGAKDQAQAASFVQLSSLQEMTLIPSEAKQAIESFLAEDEQDGAFAEAAPEADGYSFQSHGVISMLEKLLDKFIAERTQLEKEEMNTKQAYEMLMQDLKAQIEQASADREEKSSTKAKKLEAKADAEGDLKSTTETKAADTKYLEDLTATCAEKAGAFESRQQLRSEEIEAVEKAIEIVESGVQGNAEKHLPSLLQTRSSSFAQVVTNTQTRTKAKVVMYLQTKAKTLESRLLMAVAARITDDPFGKVKKLIKDLLVKLMEEANEEAEHKGWCDTELSTNEQTRKEKTDAVETLHAEVDQLESSIAKLTEDITELTQAVAALDEAVSKATTLRQEEKSKNEETVSDSQAAQTAVAQAVTVLKEFYEKAGDATAFLQQPEVFDEPYKGMGSENGGVVGMLEVIQSDFARLEADTKAGEASAQKEYDSFITDSKVDKSAKSKDIEHKETKKQDESQALTEKNEDLEGTQKELDAALAYFDKLKPSCVEAGVSYEDRVARRKEEIESLQEALKILNGEDIA